MRASVCTAAALALLSFTAPAFADDDTIPTPWGSTRRGMGPSWAPQKERNAHVARTGDQTTPLESSGLDGRHDSAAAISHLVLLVGAHANVDAGRGFGSEDLAVALDKMALGTAVEDLSARLRQARPEDRPYRPLLLATLAALYGRAGSYRFELWSLCDALLTADAGSPMGKYLQKRVSLLAGDDARAHQALLAYGTRVRKLAQARKAR